VALKREAFVIERPAEHGGNESFVKVRFLTFLFNNFFIKFENVMKNKCCTADHHV
jgi:hypothetical protein